MSTENMKFRQTVVPVASVEAVCYISYNFVV